MKTATAPKRLSRPPEVSITPRRMDFEWNEAMPRYWFGGNPVLTCFWTAFAAQFPEGERFMIQTARSFREQVKGDAELQKEVSGFIGQEGYHAFEHASLNRFLVGRGVPLGDIDGQVRWILKLLCKVFSPRSQMAMTAALEHFTSMFGNMVLQHPELIEQVDPSMRPIFVWHAIEEVEHKAVAFDLYQAVDGSYWRLVWLYIVSSLLLLLVTGGFQLRLMLSDRRCWTPRALGRSLHWMFGFGRNGGYIRRLVPEYFAFFRRSFHPWEYDNSVQLGRARSQLQVMLGGGRERAERVAA